MVMIGLERETTDLIHRVFRTSVLTHNLAPSKSCYSHTIQSIILFSILLLNIYNNRSQNIVCIAVGVVVPVPPDIATAVAS